MSTSSGRDDNWSGSKRTSDGCAGAIAQMPGRFETAAHGHEPHQHVRDLGTHPAADYEHFIDQSAPDTQLMIQPRNPSQRELIHAYLEIPIKHTVSLEVMR